MSNSPSLLTIQLSGLGLRISDSDKLLASSPSYALIESGRIQVGVSAEQQAHLRPREICTEFWQDLSGKSSTKHVVSHAEIAFKHLDAIWAEVGQAEAKVIFICPVNLDKNQLGLLLGICKKLSIKVNAIVCNAALATEQHTDAEASVYVDLLQESIVISELSQDSAGISVKLPSRELSYGLQSFEHNSAKCIAKKFISETRFDPLHSAKFEQQFHDVLVVWLSNLEKYGTTECKLTVDDKEHVVSISTQDIASTNHHIFSEISNYLNILFHQHGNLAIYCSPSTKHAFGLYEYLSDMPGCATVQLSDDSIEKHALSKPELINPSETIHFITALPWQQESITTLSYNNGSLSNLVNTPTHILISGYAHPLKNDLFLSLTEGDSDKNIIVNYELTEHSLCKISPSISDVKLEIIKPHSIILNTDELTTTSSLKINDILRFEHTGETGQLIKVVRNET